MKYFSYFLWCVFLFVVVIFSSVNSQTVSLNYYLSTAHVVLSVLVLCMIFLGFLISMVTFIPSWLRAKMRNRKLQQKVNQLESELQSLRKLPVEGGG